MTYRIMTIEDYPAMYLLWSGTPGMGLNDVDDSQAGVSRFLGRNPDTCFVALDGNKVVGTILSGHDGRRGYIYHLAVTQTHRRMGIASNLVALSLAALKQAHISKVALVVFAHNETGNLFWAQQGFTLREDLAYRDQSLITLVRMDT